MNSLEENMTRHNIGLSPYACKDEDAIRFEEESEDLRSPFFHDADRILYSYSYLRYSNKTQVYSEIQNDHISTRMIHVQYVSKIARTIGRALGLNEDLIEAASLGHDLGHVPFGHFGEAVLNDISVTEGEGYFHHNVESVRLLMEIEGKGLGKNLCLQTLDAILCHNGEFVEGEYTPRKKTKNEFLKEYQNTYIEKNVVKTLRPMTLEGCVVRLSDVIAYLGKDIDDACLLGLFQKSEIPKEISSVLGIRNREIVNTIVTDVIQESLGKPYIKMSEPVYHAVDALKKFNSEHIYQKSMSKSDQEKVTKMFRGIYDYTLECVKNKKTETKIYQNFLNHKKERYLENTNDKRKVLDFIAGMTDEYFINYWNEINLK